MFRFLVVLFFIGTWIHAAEIVPIEQDDSRVTPDFAALGQMHQVAGLIWSGVALNTMNYTDAIRFCKTLGGKARLPTKEDWIHLGRVMTRQSEIFNPELFPGMKDRWFWCFSGNRYDAGIAFYFNGDNGEINYTLRNISGWVRCVRGV